MLGHSHPEQRCKSFLMAHRSSPSLTSERRDSADPPRASSTNQNFIGGSNSANSVSHVQNNRRELPWNFQAPSCFPLYTNQYYNAAAFPHQPFVPPPLALAQPVNQGQFSYNPNGGTSGIQAFSNSQQLSNAGIPLQYSNQKTGNLQAPALAHNGGSAAQLASDSQAPRQSFPSGMEKAPPSASADSVPSDLSEFFAFLRKLGIQTVNDFLRSDISNLATAWSIEKNIQYREALDFIECARDVTRENLAGHKLLEKDQGAPK